MMMWLYPYGTSGVRCYANKLTDQKPQSLTVIEFRLNLPQLVSVNHNPQKLKGTVSTVLNLPQLVSVSHNPQE